MSGSASSRILTFLAAVGFLGLTRGGEPPPGPPARTATREDEAAAIVERWRQEIRLEASQLHLEARVVRRGDRWELQGATEHKILEQALRARLAQAGVTPLEGGLRLLPDESAGEPPFALVRVAAALSWRRPGPDTGRRQPDQVQETQLLLGEPAWILDRQGEQLLVHAASGYLGWVGAPVLRRIPWVEFARQLAAPRAVLRRDQRAGELLVPAGTALPVAARKDGRVELELPEGGFLAVPEAEAGQPDPEAGRRVADQAQAGLATPYVFGGRSRTGTDCSGLVETSWATEGILLPRDARMQALCGWLVATARHRPALRAGDLLFFLDGGGRVGHVGISLGGSRFVHATPPRVALGSLDPADPWYTPVAERFVQARRVRH